jgi:hypothetical protein
VSDLELIAPAPPAQQPPPWQWPLPPVDARRFAALQALGAAEPCSIEMQAGLTLHGAMLGFDPGKRRLQFRASQGGNDASLPFSALRRLTLHAALRPAPRAGAAARQRVAPATQLRDYTLQQVGLSTTVPLTGRTAGHVLAAEGLYLFSPVDGDGGLCRVFVPRSAYSRCEFGPSAEELAARHWIASPATLIEALRQQERAPVLSLNQALLALGLLTPGQLQSALQRADGKSALGETLVASGWVSRADLQTALALKMGFPLVDVQRFPLDLRALALLPRRLALSLRVLPLMLHDERLIVAVDRPGRLLKLRQVDGYGQRPIVAALALKSQILQALERLSASGWNLGAAPAAATTPPEA